MNPILDPSLQALRFGHPQQQGSITVLPVLADGAGAFPYTSLSQAIDTGVLSITEVSQGGSVPHLRAVNKGDHAVLLLDGEEVAGARQNRILNTSVLVDARSEVILPVSCTEAGRWHYTSQKFSDSGYIAERQVRATKTSSVEDSLRMCQEYESNQNAVWASVADLNAVAGVQSRTGAMRDAFVSSAPRLEYTLRTFPLVPGQRGIMVVDGDWVLGLDVLSRPDAYERVHRKLLGSYLLRDDSRMARLTKPAEALTTFALHAIRKASVAGFDSPGLGTDLRIRSHRCFGSALTYRDEVIHLSCFFESDHGSDASHEHFASMAQRRMNRQR